MLAVASLALSLVAAVGHAVPGSAGQGRRDPTIRSDWRTYTTSDGLPNASIRAIHVEGGDVWVGTDGGLALRDDKGWRSWTPSDGLPDASISAIDLDSRTGDVWLGTWGGGLVRFTGGRFDRFTQFNSGLAGDLILDVAVVQGVVWAATNAGISSFEPTAETWGIYLEARSDVPPHAVTGFHGSSEELLASTWYGPLLRYDREREDWLPIARLASAGGAAAPPPSPGGDASVALAEDGHALWWTAGGTVQRRRRDGSWQDRRIVVPDVAGGFVRCLAARSDREVWLGTSTGLRVLTDRDGERRVSYGRGTKGKAAAALPDDRVRCLAFEGDDVWVGTPKGLVLGSARTALRESESTDAPAALPLVMPDAKMPPGEARIGILAPSIKPISKPGEGAVRSANPVDRVAVGRAVARANERTTDSGRSFALAENLDSFRGHGWVTQQDSFAILRDRDGVSGLVAYFGSEARMDSALALRTEMPTVNIAPTVPTAAESENPWVFRCGDHDPRRRLPLLRHVFEELGLKRPAVIRTTGNGAAGASERWIEAATALGHPPVAEVTLDPFGEDLSARFEQLRRSGADVVLTWADPEVTAELLRKIRAHGLDQLVVGGDQIVNDEFAALAGLDSGAVIALARCPHFEVSGDVPPIDEATLRRRPSLSRIPVLPQADRSFVAAMHLLVAVERAGAERDAVRDALHEMSKTRLAVLKHGAWSISTLGSR